jgi:cytochrome c553
MTERVLRKGKVLSAILAVGAYFLVGGVEIVLGNSTLEGIDPKGAFLLNPKTTFEHFCAACHGERGKGDGRYYPSDLDPRPRDFTDAEFMQSRTDEQLFTAINEGSAAVGRSNRCPPWGRTIGREKIKGIIAYLRSLKVPAVESSAEKRVVSLPGQKDSTDKSLISALIGLGLILGFSALSVVYNWKKVFPHRG